MKQLVKIRCGEDTQPALTLTENQMRNSSAEPVDNSDVGFLRAKAGKGDSFSFCLLFFSLENHNDRDQFTEPYDSWRSDMKFQNDCLAFTLFSNANNIQSEAGVNHWQPFMERELGIKNELPDHFMTDYIFGKKRAVKVQSNFLEKEENNAPLIFSEEAKAVFNAGRELWKYYHQRSNADLNGSYYNIRKYFQE